MMMASVSSESLWAEHGLTGLVLSAMFGLMIFFVRLNSKKDISHQGFIREILIEERKERVSTRDANHASSEKLSAAIDGLAEELRRKKE